MPIRIPLTTPIFLDEAETLSFYQKETGHTIVLTAKSWFAVETICQGMFHGAIPGQIGSVQVYEQCDIVFILKKYPILKC